MGLRCFFSFLLWVPFCVCVIASATAQKGFTICDIPGCNCSPPKAALWKNITCNLHNTQVLNLEQITIPKDSIEIYIVGGEELNFSSKTFNTLPGLTLIQIRSTKKIVMGKKTFFNINSPSLLIEIQNCDELIIKTGAFENVQSSVSTEIINTKYVTIEQEAFSKLFNSTFISINEMTLSEGSFDFKNQGNVGRHGPVSTILFENVFIPKIPKETFLTSLASVTFRDCKIGNVYTESFKATQISAIAMVNTSLEYVQEKAFTDRTLIVDFKISKCNISRLQTEAIMAAIGNLTLSYCSITDIEARAIVTTVAKVEIIGNHITNLHTTGFIFYKWNKITFDDNIIMHLYANFIEAPLNPDIEIFSFRGNEMYITDQSALSYIAELDDRIIIFDDNFFNKSCTCTIQQWLEEITNNSKKAKVIMDSSFCPINTFLSRCFSIPVGIISMLNFTEKACKNMTVCETYYNNTPVLNKTTHFFLQTDETEKHNWFIFIIVMIGVSVVTIVVTLIILLIRGSRWLKRKAYFRNMQYNTNSQTNEEENTIVTEDENEKLEIPEELTVEFLQVLSKRLDDPKTHQEASEMIERLYEMFIIEDNYENNNRQDEEAHLYEELGNLNLQIPPPPYEDERYQHTNGPRNILKLMEEKFNTQFTDNESNNKGPALAGDYSEPTDAEIHLYSELRDKSEKKNEGSKSSVTSNSSPKEILVSLQNISDNKSLFEAGPSYKH